MPDYYKEKDFITHYLQVRAAPDATITVTVVNGEGKALGVIRDLLKIMADDPCWDRLGGNGGYCAGTGDCYLDADNQPSPPWKYCDTYNAYEAAVAKAQAALGEKNDE